jgi:REP element-mobilizing transposase RayT
MDDSKLLVMDQREGHFYRRNYPHWHVRGGVYFVTFRTYGSVPKEVIERVRNREFDLPSELPDKTKHHEPYVSTYYLNLISQLDDLDGGPHWLRQPEIVKVVKEALHYRDGREFRLYAYTIMSNHVHVLFKQLTNQYEQPIPRIMQSLKWYTAREANKILDRKGHFWKAEYYDHLVRNRTSFLNIARYIAENPVKAYLAKKWVDWPHTWVHPTLRKSLG